MKNRIELGEVILTQVQQVPLKQTAESGRFYDPAGLVSVPAIQATPLGVVGAATGGDMLLDAHHEAHPASRFRGLNGISIGFTGHYDRMRAQYGDHLWNGVAGENIIVQSAGAFTPEDLQGRLVFENPDGSTCLMRLNQAMAPCNEFSHFVHQATERLDANTLKTTLQDLDNGRRGYTLLLDGASTGVVQAGAILFLEPVPQE